MNTVHQVIEIILYIKKRKKSKLCPECGKKLRSPDDIYCISCGAFIGDKKEIFENLMEYAKELVTQGEINYSNKFFMKVVDNWNEAINSYELAKEITPSSEEKMKIEENQNVLREKIRDAFTESGIYK
ncbi:unnamed protein product [marine sediment metagenome]|uniref:Zinc-ribbon domain-containing protein n=1 Tax=marine sediment metagenome TaxID=412755 RepID=X0YZP6_9ZZZZ